MAVILLMVMITVIAALRLCYKYKKFCWRELLSREENDIPGIVINSRTGLISAWDLIKVCFVLYFPMQILLNLGVLLF